MKYNLSEAGVDLRGAAVSSHYDWSMVHKVRETRPFFLIYTSASSMHVIPKRCFNGSDAVEALRKLIRAHVPKNVKLRRK